MHIVTRPGPLELLIITKCLFWFLSISFDNVWQPLLSCKSILKIFWHPLFYILFFDMWSFESLLYRKSWGKRVKYFHYIIKLHDIMKKFDIVNLFPDSLYWVCTVLSFWYSLIFLFFVSHISYPSTLQKILKL